MFDIVRLPYCPLIDWTLCLLWESWGIWKESPQCARGDKSHVQYAHTVLRNGKRFERAPLFGSQRLQESSTFDWWLQLMSSRAYVTGTWRTDIDPFPLTHLSLCWQNMDDLNTEGRLSQIRYHILAAVVSVSITLCRLLLCSRYSIIKMKQIHSRCCGLLANSERLMIFPFVFCLYQEFFE